MADQREITAEIISIGDELLIGQTINTNAGWLGEKLALIGVRTIEVFTIADDRKAILDHLKNAKADVILITGGLGPTRDDITKATLCEFFDTPLVRDEELEVKIITFFENLGKDPLEENRAQADIPAACTKIPNSRGTASGMWFEKGERVFVSMPGIPYEMKAMMRDTILGKIKQRFHTPSIVHRTIQTTGLGESHLAAHIGSWEDSLAEVGVKLAYLPSPGLVKLRLSAYAGADEKATEHIVDQKVEQLYKLIPDIIFGEGFDTLESVIGGLLKERGESLSTAESCTGGELARMITSVPGSSAYYMGTVVTYSNALKVSQLGVTSDSLNRVGAVSAEVVEQMAQGARERLGTDWALATSGVAGPEGGTEEKPIGHVWLGVASAQGVESKLVQVPGSRRIVIERSARAALDLLRRTMKKAG